MFPKLGEHPFWLLMFCWPPCELLGCWRYPTGEVSLSLSPLVNACECWSSFPVLLVGSTSVKVLLLQNPIVYSQTPCVVGKSPFLNPPILVLAGILIIIKKKTSTVPKNHELLLVQSQFVVLLWLVLQLEIRWNPSKLCLNSCFVSHFFPLINSTPLWFLAWYPTGSHWIGSWKSRLGYMVSFPSEETSGSFQSLTGSGCVFFMGAYLQMVIFTEKKELQKPSNWGIPKWTSKFANQQKNIRKNKRNSYPLFNLAMDNHQFWVHHDVSHL